MNNRLKDLVSIIIPLYNKEASIARTLESVLAQTYDNWECVIVNDGSTDNSEDVIRPYLSNRIRCINKPNGGVSSARNRGVLESKGKWILYLDSDDILLPDGLEILVKICNDTHSPLGVANFEMQAGSNVELYVKKSADGLLSDVFKSFYFDNIFPRTGNTLIERSILDNVRFDETLRRFEDLKFTLDLLRDRSVAVSSKPVMVYTNDVRGLSIDYSNIQKDFVSKLTFTKKSFWEKIILGRLLYNDFVVYKKCRIYLLKKYNVAFVYSFIHLLIKLYYRIAK